MPARSRDFPARFIHALHQLEDTGNFESMSKLFSENCELRNPATERRHRSIRGQEGCRRFWSDYLRAFQGVHTSFDHVVETPSCVVLEWRSEGSLASGERFSYRGITVLELERGRIRMMRSYFDPASIPAGHPARLRARDEPGTEHSVNGDSYDPRQAGHPMDRSQAA